MLDNLIYGILFVFLIGVIAAVLADAAVLILWIVHPVIRLFQRVFLGIDAVRAGPETLIDSTVEIIEELRQLDDEDYCAGFVAIDGERWSARASAGAMPMYRGQLARVVSRDGLVLVIAPVDAPND